ncbi:MAG: sigma 54-interacting transcriptional regulator [Candidatus Eisenbacteria bacterium]
MATLEPSPWEASTPVYGDILGTTPRMQRIFKLISKVAPTESTVLILGESGTGKELIARAIHLQSNRQNGAFVPVNCAALPENLIESELFGYARGAFTGAGQTKRGLIEEADGGTLFLDEIGDMPLATQVKLLRFLENSELRRLGDNEVRIVDVRVIAATNSDLHRLMQEGRFREDLFYRLNVVGIELPPLRERREDVPLLASYFLEKYAQKADKTIDGFTADAKAALLRYAYPGNVRELENAIQRAVTLSDGRMLRREDLPPSFFTPQFLEAGRTAEEARDAWSLDEVERDHIARVLKRQKGNVTNAARQLGISRTTLWRKMNKYNLTRPPG